MNSDFFLLRKSLDGLLYANLFHDTISSSKWFLNKSISVDDYALGYPALYYLYRILNTFRPAKVLELGLGQSSLMISQYRKFYDFVNYKIIEQSSEWIDFLLIDGPCDPIRQHNTLARRDIFNIAQFLNKEFIILLDDTNRIDEQKTIIDFL